MAEETIQILKLQVQGAETVADLRENVKQLKTALKEAEAQSDSTEGWEHYQQTLELLKQNQAALKDAVYATSGSFDDVKKAAVGASDSYNSLVNRMADLKREFRATNDEARRTEIGDQIRGINDELKRMDALQGNFQRNVGNYSESIKSAFKDMAEKTDALGKSFNIANGGVNGFKDSFEAFSKSPAIATFGILVSLVVKLAGHIKEDEDAMASLKKGMDALKPVMDFLSGILDKMVGYLADLIEKAVTFVTSNGLFDKIIKGAVGVGNAVLEFIVAPVKGIIAAIKVFQEEGVKGFGNAAKAFGREMQSGVAFKENFKAGQAVADAMSSGVRSRKKEVEKAGKETGKKLGEEMYKAAMEAIAKADKASEDKEKARQKLVKDIDSWIKEMDAETTAGAADEFQANLEQLTAWVEAEQALREKDLEDARVKAEAKKEMMQSLATNTSSILSSIADLYESDSEAAEKNANKIKALRIAAATIDTISGAIGAFMQATETIPPPFGQIVGAAEAAAITAAGLANIAKMRSTKVSTDGTSSTPTFDASTTAPVVQQEVQNVRTVTSASEETRLNRMASEQRVYILQSDIEAAGNASRTRVEESSF